jgi:hypothetical protein
MSTPIPDPKSILQGHIGLLRLIVSGLQSGTIHTQAYADWQKEPIDRYLAPPLVRKGLKRFLARHGQEAAEEEQESVADGDLPEYRTQHLSNLGLALRAAGVCIRVLRSDHGSLPVPGPSKARQLFYAQQAFLPFPELSIGSDDEQEPSINLVLYWTTDEKYNLNRVCLACPKAGNTTRESVQTHWDRTIWRHRSDEVAGTHAEAEGDELDIHLDDAEEASGTEE